MSPPLLTTKLLVPPVRRELVPRSRLTQQLDAGLRAAVRLTLISAPAGYSKTTLVAAWLTGRGEREQGCGGAGERLMEPAAAGAINNGQFTTLSRWLDALPEAHLRGSPELAALKGWALPSVGQFAAAAGWIGLDGVATELLNHCANP